MSVHSSQREGARVPDPITTADDLHLVDALRTGDEAAFAGLVDQYFSAMVRIAMIYVRDEARAQGVVQDTWLAVVEGIDRFEGRSSLKTWLFRILTNIAKSRAQREGRSVPFSSLGDLDAEPTEPAVPPGRFLPPDHPKWPGHWASPPQSWNDLDDRLASAETCAYVKTVIATLPARQREVITLRDIEDWTAEEVCHILALSETNQRVLLHRARSSVRRALEEYLRQE